MFNMSFWELIAIFIIGLLVLGPKELPKAARAFIKILNEFKRISNSVEDSLQDTPSASSKEPDKPIKNINKTQTEISPHTSPASKTEISTHTKPASTGPSDES